MVRASLEYTLSFVTCSSAQETTFNEDLTQKVKDLQNSWQALCNGNSDCPLVSVNAACQQNNNIIAVITVPAIP